MEGSAAGGSFLTAGVTYFKLRTKCINGEQGFANVLFVGVGLSIGADFSFSSSNVTLEDSLWDVHPQILHGDGVIANAGLSLPNGRDFTATLVLSQLGKKPEPNGFGCSAIRLDNAGGTGCGAFTGLEFGLGVLYGSSTVLSSGVQPCDCGSGE